MKAPAYYIGEQEDLDGGTFALYNLTADVPGHCEGSTVSGDTLTSLGFDLPPKGLCSRSCVCFSANGAET